MESTYLIGLGWILGLLSRLLPQIGPSWGWAVPMIAGLAGAIAFRQRPRLARTVLVAGVVSLLAWFYLGLRAPTPDALDVSRFAPSRQAVVVGQVLTDPQQTRSGRERFWLETTQYIPEEGQPEPATGKIYTTLNPDVIENLDIHPSQVIQIRGSLYLPSPASNPGGFDFQKYLAQQGAFAGISAYEIEVVDPGRDWGGWALRRRIRGALVDSLGPTQGELLSSMVLGSRAAELDYDLRDTFRRVGLSHVLAASGFHVSLLIAVVIALVNSASPRQQQIVVFSTLGIYILLTGFSPSVLRASLMGVAATLMLTEPDLKKKAKLQPLGVLLVAAILLLIWKPTWISDIGFLLSFAATLGLLVSVEPFTKRLDWLPLGLAVPVAVTLSAQLWTLPLQMLFFGQIPNYSLVANLATLMFIIVLAVIGFGVCGIALVSPATATLVAAPLQFIITPLINIVSWIGSWPRATYYVGQVSWVQCAILYGVLGSIAFWPYWRERVRLVGTAAIMIMIVWLPNFIPGPSVQITALATRQAPVMVIQTRREVIVINSGSSNTVQYTLLPFLRNQGIGHIDHAVATAPEGGLNAGWLMLLDEVSVDTFWSGTTVEVSGAYRDVVDKLNSRNVEYRQLQPGGRLTTSDLIDLQALHSTPLVLGLEVNAQPTANWLLIGTASSGVQSTLVGSVPVPIEWVWWDGGALSVDLLQQHQVAGGITTNGWQEELPWFSSSGRELYDTERDGALTWKPPNQIETLNVAIDQ